jgi:hypothetical protein
MTYKIIGILDLNLDLNDSVIAASSDDTKRASTRPLARAPDTPSSTR